jgi:iron(III) transport system substrate-binding protein
VSLTPGDTRPELEITSTCTHRNGFGPQLFEEESLEMNKVKILVPTVSALTLVALAACSSGSPTTSPTAPTTTGAAAPTSAAPDASTGAPDSSPAALPPITEATNLAETGGMDALIAAAKAEGSVMWYGPTAQEKAVAWVAGFTEKYGIPVEVYRAPTNQLYQKFDQEQSVGQGQADILQLSDPNVLNRAIEAGYLADYTPATDDQFIEGTAISGTAYPVYTSLQAVGWNTNLVPADLQELLQSDDTLNALLDPRLKGHIGITDVTAGGPQIASSANLVFNLAGEYGWDYFEKLAAQDVTVVDTSTTLVQGLQAGDYWAAFDGTTSILAPAVVAGAPVAFRSPPVSSSSEFTMSTVKDSPHPAAARLFMEWATSLEAQSAMANIAQADVLINGWVDEREVSQQPWYTPPATLWNSWSDLPEVQGDALTAFYDQWHQILGQS